MENMDEGNQPPDSTLAVIEDEPMDVSEEDKEQSDILNLMGNTDNCMYTIQVTPGTTMHIKIAPETGPIPATWCISTLLIHNGQHYANTIHNFTVHPELIRSLGLAQSPVRGTVLEQLLHNPLDLPRNPVDLLTHLDGLEYLQPLMIRMAQSYSVFVQRVASLMDSITEHTNTANEVTAMLEARQARFNQLHLDDDEDYITAMQMNQAADVDDSEEKSDDDSQPCEFNECGRFSEMRGTIFNGPDFQEFPQQFWSMNSSEEEPEEESEEDSFDSDFEDDESFFDAYMVRHLRTHAPNLGARFAPQWLPRRNNEMIVQSVDDSGSCGILDDSDDDSTVLSDTSEEINAWKYCEDRSFETALSRPLRRLIGELPALTALEQRQRYHPLPELNELIQQQQESAQSSPSSSRTYPIVFDHEPMQPFSFHAHWPQHESHANSNSNATATALVTPVRSRFDLPRAPLRQIHHQLSLSPAPFIEVPRGQHRQIHHQLSLSPAPFTFGFAQTDTVDTTRESIFRNFSFLQGNQNADLIDDPDSEPDVEMKLAPKLSPELKPQPEPEMETDSEPEEIPLDQQIMPLQTYIQQTDDLIAQIKANLQAF